MVDAHRRTAIAERAARAGGAVARQAFRGELSTSTKSDETDLVTEADHDSQRQAVASIVDEFPNDAIVGEEGAIAPATTGETADPNFVDSIPDRGDAWVIDPIDGTANFVRGLDLWTTSVAAVVDGEPVGAATYLPVVGEIYTAGENGTMRDGESLSVSDRTDPALFAVSIVGRLWPDESAQVADATAAAIERFGDLRRFGTMQATLAFVANGGLDAAFMASRPEPWDSVAGVHLIREAGGTVTDLDGDRWTHESDALVASNGEAHEAVREVAAKLAD